MVVLCKENCQPRSRIFPFRFKLKMHNLFPSDRLMIKTPNDPKWPHADVTMTMTHLLCACAEKSPAQSADTDTGPENREVNSEQSSERAQLSFVVITVNIGQTSDCSGAVIRDTCNKTWQNVTRDNNHKLGSKEVRPILLIQTFNCVLASNYSKRVFPKSIYLTTN